MERTFLVALDGSPLSEGVMHYLPALVRPNDEITLLKVVPQPSAMPRSRTYEPPVLYGHNVMTLEPTTAAYAEDTEQAMARAKDEARDYLEAAALFLRNEGLTVRTDVVLDNDPVHGIVEYARDMGPLFIAMATHGRGGIDHVLHGSVAEGVMRSRIAPVLVVRP